MDNPRVSCSIYPPKELDKGDFFALILTPEEELLMDDHTSLQQMASGCPIDNTWVFSLSAKDVDGARAEALRIVREFEPRAREVRVMRVEEVESIVL